MPTRTYDFTGFDDDKFEQGDVIPDGWYAARVTDAGENYETDAIFLKYTITSGPYAGRELTDNLHDPELASDTKKADFMKRKIGLVAKRLGLIGSQDGKQAGVAIEWDAAMGKDCFIKVKTTEGERGGKFSNITFDGVFGVDDERVPDLARQGLPCPLNTKSAADHKKATDKAMARAAKALEKNPKASQGSQASAGSARQTAPVASQQDFGDL